MGLSGKPGPSIIAKHCYNYNVRIMDDYFPYTLPCTLPTSSYPLRITGCTCESALLTWLNAGVYSVLG